MISLALTLVMLAGTCNVAVAGNQENTQSEVVSTNKVSISDAISYKYYQEQHNDKEFHNETLTILASQVTKLDGGEIVDEYFGKENVILTDEQGSTEWEFVIDKSGMYSINVEYYPMEGYGSTIVRNILIDGEVPFEEAKNVEFSRFYADDEAGGRTDTVWADQVEIPHWSQCRIKDAFCYYGEALYFYLEKGTHTLSIVSEKEPMAISQITLSSEKIEVDSYEEVYARHLEAGAVNAEGVFDGGVLYLQAESCDEKSDPTLHGKNDNTSTKNHPYSTSKKLINVVAGSAWKYPGQWMSWKVTIPESGFYYIGSRSKQNYAQDIYSNRTIYIDGELPFKEAANNHFYYDEDWQTDEFGGETPYLFYLEEGEHEITLKQTSGDMCDILVEADEVLENLNSINIKLLSLLGATPDTDRDYQIATYMPETVEALKVNAEALQAIHDSLIEMTGANNSLTAQLNQLIFVLEKMYTKPSNIASQYTRFRDLVGTFGNWIMTVREHQLMIDYIYIAEPSANVDKSNDSFIVKLTKGVKELIYSFTEDENILGSGETLKDAETITVWIGSGITGGRDQASALNEMILKDFTEEYGINVELQLVPENTILMASLTDNSPDVVLQTQGQVPVDFALRNAVYDLTLFEDYEEVAERFYDSAIEPFEYDGGVYALPETLSYNMLFYRTDILEDLGIEPEQLTTWESIIEILPVLQSQNMNIAMPAIVSSFTMFLYQFGGEYYTEDNKASALDEKVSLDAFKFWTDFYTEYSLPVDYSFENRFRTGEMPIGVADYTMYNLLSISAPEIKGKWAMTVLPGVEQEDGSINNVSPATSKGCILMNSSDNKEAAWTFMKWWTDADAQYEFGSQLEAVMGAAARYNTANIEALKRMPWSATDRIGLLEQLANLRGVPNIPGGYYTERNVNFAKLAVINNGEDPRDQLMKYSDNITEEITVKRSEFGLE